MICQLEAEEIFALCRQGVALPPGSALDDVLLAALVRRAAGFMCPCSPRTLARAVTESLNHLAEDSEALAEAVETAVEKAMIIGDLLELGQITTDDPEAKGTWIFAAPPAFIARPNGGIFFVGIASEEPNPLPRALAARLAHDRHFRFISAQPHEDLPQALRDFGVLELSERNWLKLPKEESAKEFRDRIERELRALPPSGDVAELAILNSSTDVTYYKGRWVEPRRASGSFVARRPQAYGAPIWGFALLNEGTLERFLDFPLKGRKERGSDCAWHLQMAIDHGLGVPQKYRKRPADGGAHLDFFSPVPLWAERRLSIIGRTAQRERCLFSYFIPETELEAEEQFLQRRLWLAPLESGGE